MEVVGLRKGSIVIDFHVTECRSVKIHEVMGLLKAQLMNPSSILLDGKVTAKAVSMIGEVERCKLDGEDVRKSGLFFMGTPEDGTAVIPGGSTGQRREMIMETTSQLPVGIRGGGRTCKGEFGERDVPPVLYYYPGGEGVHVAEELPTKQRTQGWVEGKSASQTVQGELLESSPHPSLRVSPVQNLRASPALSTSSSRNLYVEPKVAENTKRSELSEGESVLAALLGEVKGTGGSSLLARLFVELLVVQKQAVVRRR